MNRNVSSIFCLTSAILLLLLPLILVWGGLKIMVKDRPSMEFDFRLWGSLFGEPMTFLGGAIYPQYLFNKLKYGSKKEKKAIVNFIFNSPFQYQSTRLARSAITQKDSLICSEILLYLKINKNNEDTLINIYQVAYEGQNKIQALMGLCYMNTQKSDIKLLKIYEKTKDTEIKLTIIRFCKSSKLMDKLQSIEKSKDILEKINYYRFINKNLLLKHNRQVNIKSFKSLQLSIKFTQFIYCFLFIVLFFMGVKNYVYKK